MMLFAHLILVTQAGVLPTPSAVDSARSYFESRMKALKVPGAQLVVLVDGQPSLTATFGQADSGGKEPVTGQTRFRAGSISKLLTATAAAKLWEMGALSLDDPIERLVPEFPGRPSVTARLLGGHLAGLRHYIGRDFITPPRPYVDVIEALAIFATDTLVAPPGSRYLYSSFGYNLLGAAVQRAAREDFRIHIQKVILGPFGMTSTLFERSDSGIANLTRGFEPTDSGRVRPSRRTDLSDRWPSGGLLSTATDLARFGERSVRGALLSSQIRALLFTPMHRSDGASTKVGFGWRVGLDPSGRAVYHHGGASTGGRAMLVVWRDTPLVVAVMTNLSPGAGAFSESDAMTIGAILRP